MFRQFRKFPSFIFHHFRFISGLFRRSYFIISGLLCISEIFRLVSISLPSPSLSDVRSLLFCMFPYFRKSPSFIFHHFRFLSGLFRVLFPEISVIHISSFPFHFRIIPSSCFLKFPSFISHHFPVISGLFRRLISGLFCHSYFIFSASFPDDTVLLFPEISVVHISSSPFHFRIIPSSYFWKFPSVISLIIPVSFPKYSVVHISSFPFHFRFIPSFKFHHFRFISGIFRRSYFTISVSFPEYSVVHISSFPFHFRFIPSFIFHHFRFISGLFRRPPVLAVRVIFDLGLFSLETETQHYVLLGTRHTNKQTNKQTNQQSIKQTNNKKTNTHTHTYTHPHSCIRKCSYIHIDLPTHLSVYRYIYLSVCLSVYKYRCMCMYIYIYMFIYVCVCVCLCMFFKSCLWFTALSSFTLAFSFHRIFLLEIAVPIRRVYLVGTGLPAGWGLPTGLRLPLDATA